MTTAELTASETETPAASSTVLRNVLHDTNLDSALKTLQEALGIRTGDVAALHCQKNAMINEVWERTPLHKRAEFISEYLTIEAAYSA